MQEYCEPCVVELPQQRLYRTTLSQIMKRCCDYFGVSEEYITKRNRKRERVLMRQMAMYMCKIYTTCSLMDIGYFFEGRDHTTVIHAITTINDLCETDEIIADDFKRLKNFVKE